ncbi:hypothetical protein [Pedobacter zeae]|nr:hypothetical protein [Pedobacter zeae]MBB4106632.1 hypothetical protein [Pedobacter zeae]
MKKNKEKTDKIVTLRLKESEIRLAIEGLIFACKKLDELADEAPHPEHVPAEADRLQQLYENIRSQLYS